MGISLSPFQPGAVNNQGGAPDALAQLLAALTQGADIGAAGARTEVQRKSEENRLKLDQKKVDLDIAKEKAAMEREKALGELKRILFQDIADKGGMSPFSGAMPQGQQPMGSGVGGQNTPVPQGGGLPAISQTPSGTWTPPNDGTPPMAAFMRNLEGVPSELVNSYFAQNLPFVTQEQEKYDLGIAFDEAEVAVAPLLTPQQRAAFKVGRNMALSGAPKEMYEQFMPKAQMELASAVEQAKAAKSKKEADAIAFPYLVAYGVAAMDAPPTNAADKLYELRRDLLRQAKEAKVAEGRANIDLAVKGLEGVALDMAMQSGLTKPKEIFDRLRGMAIYDQLPDGVLLKAANEAPRKASDLTAPRNERQAAAQAVAGTGLLAYSRIEDLAKKGTNLGMAAYIASTPQLATATAGAAAGAAAGSQAGKLFKNPMAKAGGAVAGGLVGAGVGTIVAPLAEVVMSSNEQEMYTAGQDFMDMVLRPRTGAVINAVERLTTMQTYLPFKWDSDSRKELKTALRARAAEVAEQLANLPLDMQSDILKARREQDRRLLGIPEDGKVDSSATAGRVSGPTDNFVFRPKRSNETASEYADAYEAAFGNRNRPRSAPSLQRVDPLGRPIGRPRQPD